MLYFFKTIFKIHLKSLLIAVLAVFLSAESIFAYTAVVESSKLNMRVKPERGAKVVVVLSRGDVVEVFGDIDGPWVEAVYRGKSGFLRNRPVYIRYEKNAGAAKKLNAEVKQEKSEIKAEIKKHKKVLDKYRKKADEIMLGLGDIDRAVSNSEKKLNYLKKDYFDVNSRIRKENKRLKNVEKEIRELKPFVEKRLVALYKLSRVGSMNLLFSADSVVDFSKRQKALKEIVGSDLVLIEKYSKYRDEYISLGKSLEKEKVKIEALKKDISKYLRIKDSEKKKKKRLLSEIRKKEKIKSALIENLEEASKELDRKLFELNKAEKKLFFRGFKSFKSHKGLLNAPVKGKVISSFGKKKSRKSFLTHKRGIDIQADLGEPVHSVFSGEVVFSDWFKGYGNMMIINHGKNYYSIYAHVQEFFKQKGDKVIKDEVIATIGETGSIMGPVLYFEIRHHGKPLNPMEWIKK